jgi:hypothetical protein
VFLLFVRGIQRVMKKDKATNKLNLGATVQPELVKALDEFRGEVPRSRVVEKALTEFLARQIQKVKEKEVLAEAVPADKN